VDEAGNALSAECVRGAIALESGRDLVRITPVLDREVALDALRHGRYRGVWVLPFGLKREGPPPSFIGDNTDRFTYEAIDTALGQIWAEVSAPSRSATAAAVRLEAYPYLEPEDIQACLVFARRLVGRERVEPAIDAA